MSNSLLMSSCVAHLCDAGAIRGNHRGQTAISVGHAQRHGHARRGTASRNLRRVRQLTAMPTASELAAPFWDEMPSH